MKSRTLQNHRTTLPPSRCVLIWDEAGLLAGTYCERPVLSVKATTPGKYQSQTRTWNVFKVILIAAPLFFLFIKCRIDAMNAKNLLYHKYWSIGLITTKCFRHVIDFLHMKNSTWNSSQNNYHCCFSSFVFYLCHFIFIFLFLATSLTLTESFCFLVPLPY